MKLELYETRTKLGHETQLAWCFAPKKGKQPCFIKGIKNKTSFGVEYRVESTRESFRLGKSKVNSCVTASSYSLRAKSTLERNGQSSFQKGYIT